MTAIPTYVSLIPLPAPVTSGTTIQTYTDPNGDVWVAKNGVNGGNWLRARDVLYCRMTRAAAMNLTTSQVTMPYDTTYRDAYGMWTPAQNGVLAPVAGLYRADVVLCGAFTATGQTMNIQINLIGGGGYTRINRQSAFAGNTYVESHDEIFMPTPGTYLGVGVYASATLALAGLNNFDNYFTIQYMGTG
jgi:hypothetical protein